MRAERKAIVVYYEHAIEQSNSSLDELNALLNEGWLPIHATGMGGSSLGQAQGGEARTGHAALVILQREKDYEVTGFGQ
jgi:hypothetical protein